MKNELAPSIALAHSLFFILYLKGSSFFIHHFLSHFIKKEAICTVKMEIVHHCYYLYTLKLNRN
jgi:hypothetical protein